MLSHLTFTAYLLCATFTVSLAGLVSLIRANGDIRCRTCRGHLGENLSRIDTIPPVLSISASTLHPRAFAIRSDDGWMMDLDIVSFFVPLQPAARVLGKYISESFLPFLCDSLNSGSCSSCKQRVYAFETCRSSVGKTLIE